SNRICTLGAEAPDRSPSEGDRRRQRSAHRGRFTRTKEFLMTISTVTIVGAGYMGGGIAQVLAIAGFQVTVADVSVDNANASLERLQKEARDFEEQGLYAPGSADLVAENISAGKTLEEAVADVDFIEEAVFERVDVKRDVLAKISEHARPDAIIGTNTSTIPAKELESAVKHPARFLTVHFSNPAPFIPRAELLADAPSVVGERVATAGDLDSTVRPPLGFRLGCFAYFAPADQGGPAVHANCFATFEDACGGRLCPPQILTDAGAADRKGVKN